MSKNLILLRYVSFDLKSLSAQDLPELELELRLELELELEAVLERDVVEL